MKFLINLIKLKSISTKKFKIIDMFITLFFYTIILIFLSLLTINQNKFRNFVPAHKPIIDELINL